MQKTILYNRGLLFLLITLIVSPVLKGQVVTRDTLVSWRHFEYSLDEYNGMDSYSTTQIVEDLYPGIVLENEFVRLVVMPEFGGRISSFYFKPTGHEQFYINPVGAPYGMNDGNFYYDWLMVFGGVFPTFPEPEHGKTWFLPWTWQITENNSDVVTIRMELQDTINYPYHPGKFNNGVTGIRCIAEVTLRKGKTSFELVNTLQNTKNEEVSFEYWTCTTLAPGSEPGNTFTPANSEIVVPMDYIYLKDDWWSWMGQAENPASGYGSHVFEFYSLATYANWQDMGIGYAYPSLESNFYGVINHENNEGVFRVSDNDGVTPGMKIWTWGAQQGLNADPENFYNNARPYIELWSGFSDQFFEDATLQPNEEITWTETYIPVSGMEYVREMSEHGALNVGYSNDGSEHFAIHVFNTTPSEQYHIQASLSGTASVSLLDEDYMARDHLANEFLIFLNDYFIEDGDYELHVVVKDKAGQGILDYSLPVTIPFPSQGIPSLSETPPRLSLLPGNMVKLEFTESHSRILEVYNLSGQLLERRSSHNKSEIIALNKSGVYIIRIVQENISYSLKIII